MLGGHNNKRIFIAVFFIFSALDLLSRLVGSPHDNVTTFRTNSTLSYPLLSSLGRSYDAAACLYSTAKSEALFWGLLEQDMYTYVYIPSSLSHSFIYTRERLPFFSSSVSPFSLALRFLESYIISFAS